MNADVGVVIPSFNRPIETKRAVESVLRQTVLPRQIVVVDDGSNSENVRILSDLLEELKVELIFMPASRHPGIARNYGIARLSTKWVAFLDSDDVWVPEKLETQINGMEASKADASCTNAYVNYIDSDALYLPKFKSKWLNTKLLLNDNRVINSSVVVDRILLERVGNVASSYSSRGAEDFATWLRISTITDWLYLSEPLVVYTADSPDSLRKSNEFSQNYLHVSGILDFQSWLESRGESRGKLIRLYLKFLSPLVQKSRKPSD
jgi:glycosyltransferase involved in cell wall biosynthesis